MCKNKNYLKTENDWCALPIPDAPWMELDEETLQSNKERERKIAESYNQ